MNKLAIATCLFGFIALASTAPAPEQCLQLLADELVKIEVPRPISAYVANLTSVLPVDGENEWDEAEFKKIESKVEYPWSACFFYPKHVARIVEKVLAQRNDCAELINKAFGQAKHDDEQALKELRKKARAHETLGPRMSGQTACTKFQPYGDLEALPPCFQGIVDRARTVEVPEEIQQFVHEARRAEPDKDEIMNHENLQRFSSDDRVEKCTIFVETMKDVDLRFNEEVCPDEWKEFRKNFNLGNGWNRLAWQDEAYAMVKHAAYACKALVTPGFGMEQ